MNLRLVETDNVVALPVANMTDVVACARGFADAVEAGDIDAVQVILVTVDSEGFLDIATFGEPAMCDTVIGQLELAKHKVINGTLG